MDLPPKEEQLIADPVLVGGLLALYLGHRGVVELLVRQRGLQVRVAVFAEGAVALACVVTYD